MTEPMKAYNVRDKNSFYSTVVFAESSNKAKAIAMHTDACEYSTGNIPLKHEAGWY